MSDDLVVPGKKVVKLMLVEVNDGELKGRQAKQSNKFYNMYEQEDGTFIASYGRVDSTETRKTYPMDKWDKTYKSKTTRKKSPYKDVTHLFQEEDEGSDDQPTKIVQIKDTAVRSVMNSLQTYANKSIQQNYTVSARSVTQAMVDEAQDIVDQLVTDANEKTPSAKTINKNLLDLFHVIPRKMVNVKSHLIDEKNDLVATRDDILKMIEDEQQTLDVMAGQVNLNSKEEKTESKQSDILTMLGLEMTKASADDIETIKRLMGPNARQFKAAYAVKHLATQKSYDRFVDKVSNKQSELFWHGSRNQNWLNILSTGLMIRPAGAIHTGSMFGDGIYFADKAQKSIGYTSLRGSYWASGYDNTAYLALFSVHVGEQKHIKHHDRSCYSLSKRVLEREGFDSVFAHGGADLRNNEYIVYDSAQCTVSFLVEIGN